MLLFLKKKSDTQTAAPEPRALHDFIPYHSHANPHTLLTKNGEAMQIIRITADASGLNYESGESEVDTVRAAIRGAIVESGLSERYAVWVHTLRKRRPVHYDSRFDNPFAAYVHAAWQRKYHWKYQYYNEIYVSVLREGQGGDLFDKGLLKAALLPRQNRDYRNRYLDRIIGELDEVAGRMAARIGERYRAERLAMVERSSGTGPAVFYSEPLEFLGTLINLRAQPFPVFDADIGRELSTHQVIFGFNALETKLASGQKRFGALLSLKHYREVPPAAADRLLQAPLELIVSQSFSFVPARRALKEYRAQKEIFDISGDGYSVSASGLDEMLQSSRGLATDFGEMQTTVTVIADEYRHLDEEVQKAQAAFGEMGLITVREDIKLEECFWAGLPGNFEFIRRKDIVPTSRLAGFARLNLFSGGRAAGNHWGEAVALLPTQVRSPYFFNFHHGDNGHTLVFDFNAFRDNTGTALVNFLLTSAMKYRPRLFVFDRKHSARLWFDKMKGRYHHFAVGRRKAALAVNPFSLEGDKRNRGFLLAWIASLLETGETDRQTLSAALDALYALPSADRHLRGFADLVASDDYRLAARLRAFLPGGRYEGLFDAESETLDLSQPLHAFHMDSLLAYPECAVPMFAYLMHRIVTSLTGTPAILVLHEAWDLLENPFFAPRLESLMEILKQTGAMLVCTTQRPDAATSKTTFATLMAGAATQLYLPDDIALDYAAHAPTLGAQGAKMLKSMDRQKGDFLLRQGDEYIALRAGFEEMDDARAIFADDVKNLIAAGGAFASLPESYDPSDV